MVHRFSNKRAGKLDTFYIYKFRTMKKYADIPSDKLVTNPFYTGGNMLRKLSIDEIPQLINKLRIILLDLDRITQSRLFNIKKGTEH